MKGAVLKGQPLVLFLGYRCIERDLISALRRVFRIVLFRRCMGHPPSLVLPPPLTLILSSVGVPAGSTRWEEEIVVFSHQRHR